MIILEGKNIELLTYNNGYSYNLLSSDGKIDIFAQGQDATEFYNELTDIEETYPNATTTEVLYMLAERYT